MSSYSMPFGKHKGKHLSTVPTPYLWWVLRECDLSELPQLRAAIQSTLQSKSMYIGCSPTKKKRYKKRWKGRNRRR